MASTFNTLWLFILSTGLQAVLALGMRSQIATLDVSALFGISLGGIFVGGFSSVLIYGFWKSTSQPRPVLFASGILFQIACVLHSIYVLNATFISVPRN